MLWHGIVAGLAYYFTEGEPSLDSNSSGVAELPYCWAVTPLSPRIAEAKPKPLPTSLTAQEVRIHSRKNNNKHAYAYQLNRFYISKSLIGTPGMGDFRPSQVTSVYYSIDTESY